MKIIQLRSDENNRINYLSILHKKPIGNAILTCFSKDQAKKRFNRGAEAAKAVVSPEGPQPNSRKVLSL